MTFDRIKSNPYALSAISIWLVGVVTTLAFFHQLGISIAAAIPAAFVSQLLLTFLQRLAYKKSEYHDPVLGFVALAIDSFINLGGSMAALDKIHNTASYQSISDNAPAYFLRFGFAILLSLLIAIAPERLWSLATKYDQFKTLQESHLEVGQQTMPAIKRPISAGNNYDRKS